MKLNPYPVLLTIGALMFATVFFAQTGANAALLRAGVAAVDKDVSKFAAKTVGSLQRRRSPVDEPSSDETDQPEAAVSKVRLASQR